MFVNVKRLAASHICLEEGLPWLDFVSSVHIVVLISQFWVEWIFVAGHMLTTAHFQVQHLEFHDFEEKMFFTCPATPTNWKWWRCVDALWHNYFPLTRTTQKQSWKWRRCMVYARRRTVMMRLPMPGGPPVSIAAARSHTASGSMAPVPLCPTLHHWGRWAESDTWRPLSGCHRTSVRTSVSSRRSHWANASASTGYVENWAQETSPRSSWVSMS